MASLPLSWKGEGVADGIAFGVIFVGQYVVLRGVILKASRWLWASLIGGALALVIGIIPGDRVQDAIDGIKSSPVGLAGIGPGRSAVGYFVGAAVLGAAFGASLGLAPWLILRWRFVRASSWITANALGFSVGMLLQGLMGASYPLFVAAGLTTSLTFKWLLRKPPPERSEISKRPLGVLVLGVAFLLISPFLFTVAIVGAFADNGGSGGPPGNSDWSSALWVILILAGLAIALGMALLKRHNWARVIVLIVAANDLLGMAMAHASVSGLFVVCWTGFHLVLIWYMSCPLVVWFFGVDRPPERAVSHA